MGEQWTRSAVTDEQLAKERREALPVLREARGPLHDGFTCDDCGARWTCLLVFDPYNTDGDCLMDK